MNEWQALLLELEKFIRDSFRSTKQNNQSFFKASSAFIKSNICTCLRYILGMKQLTKPGRQIMQIMHALMG